MKVKVYFNLHTFKWSIKDAKSGLVLGHASDVMLENVTPQVSQAGRRRVIAEQRKNVHAFLVGNLVAVSNFNGFRGRVIDCDNDVTEPERPSIGVTYNPYKHTGFVTALEEKSIVKMDLALLNSKKKVFGYEVVVK